MQAPPSPSLYASAMQHPASAYSMQEQNNLQLAVTRLWKEFHEHQTVRDSSLRKALKEMELKHGENLVTAVRHSQHHFQEGKGQMEALKDLIEGQQNTFNSFSSRQLIFNSSSAAKTSNMMTSLRDLEQRLVVMDKVKELQDRMINILIERFADQSESIRKIIAGVTALERKLTISDEGKEEILMAIRTAQDTRSSGESPILNLILDMMNAMESRIVALSWSKSGETEATAKTLPQPSKHSYRLRSTTSTKK